MVQIIFIVGVLLAVAGAISNIAVVSTTTSSFWGNDATSFNTAIVVTGIAIAIFSWRAMEKPELPHGGKEQNPTMDVRPDDMEFPW